MAVAGEVAFAVGEVNCEGGRGFVRGDQVPDLVLGASGTGMQGVNVALVFFKLLSLAADGGFTVREAVDHGGHKATVVAQLAFVFGKAVRAERQVIV